LLLEHGSCHFDQIAGWSAADLDWIELKVSFAGRVGREGGVSRRESSQAIRDSRRRGTRH